MAFLKTIKIHENKDCVPSTSLSVWCLWLYTQAVSKARSGFHLILESHLYTEQNGVHCSGQNLRHDIPFVLCYQYSLQFRSIFSKMLEDSESVF